MNFYESSVGNPGTFLGRVFASRLHAAIAEGQPPPKYEGVFDEGLFQKFLDQFNRISITSGLPRGDYGQTVNLSRVESPKLDEMEWRYIPPHIFGNVIKATEISERYGYRNAERCISGALIVEEFFFFGFHAGYSLKTFSDLNTSLAALRYLS